jgi:hypothetical protein
MQTFVPFGNTSAIAQEADVPGELVLHRLVGL